MRSYYKWVLELWYFEIKWKNKGFWRLEISYLNRNKFDSKRKLAFYTEAGRKF